MSMTCGPIVPVRIGNVTGGEPSENSRVAVGSVMVIPSCGAKPSDERLERGIVDVGASAQHVPQCAICHMEKPVQICNVVFGQRIGAGVEKAREDQVVLEHAPPAAPANPLHARLVDHCLPPIPSASPSDP